MFVTYLLFLPSVDDVCRMSDIVICCQILCIFATIFSLLFQKENEGGSNGSVKQVAD